MSVIEKRVKDKIIYISDSSKELKVLKDENLPVIALLTKENKKTDLSFIHYAVENVEDIDDEFAEKVYCRAHQLPVVIEKDEKIYLREFLISDVKDIKEIYQDDKNHYLECFFDNEEELEAYLKSYIENHYDFYGYGMWAICLVKTGEVIGMGGFSARDSDKEEEKVSLEIGFAIKEKARGSGYATRACKLMKEYAKQELDYAEIFAVTKEENRAARRVLEKVHIFTKYDRMLKD